MNLKRVLFGIVGKMSQNMRRVLFLGIYQQCFKTTVDIILRYKRIYASETRKI